MCCIRCRIAVLAFLISRAARPCTTSRATHLPVDADMYLYMACGFQGFIVLRPVAAQIEQSIWVLLSGRHRISCSIVLPCPLLRETRPNPTTVWGGYAPPKRQENTREKISGPQENLGQSVFGVGRVLRSVMSL